MARTAARGKEATELLTGAVRLGFFEDLYPLHKIGDLGAQGRKLVCKLLAADRTRAGPKALRVTGKIPAARSRDPALVAKDAQRLLRRGRGDAVAPSECTHGTESLTRRNVAALDSFAQVIGCLLEGLSGVIVGDSHAFERTRA